MKRKSLISARFLLPGFFLLLLGLGNIGVGHFKGAQYEQVLAELSEPHATVDLVNASPLRRIELARQSVNRLSLRRSKAKARRDFYQLVTFGGKAFVILSSVLLFAGLGFRYIERNGQQQRPAGSRPLPLAS